MNLLTLYLAGTLGAYVVQQGEDWSSFWNPVRFFKAMGWPLLLLRPLLKNIKDAVDEDPNDGNIDPRSRMDPNTKP